MTRNAPILPCQSQNKETQTMDTLPIDKVVENWNQGVAVAAADYEYGVRNPRRDWQAATLAAADAWKIALTAAIAANAFQAGVTAAGTAKWQKGCIELGIARWPVGVAAAQDAYRAGMAPYLAELQRLTLPRRYARGDIRNYDRVMVIGKALFNLRTR